MHLNASNNVIEMKLLRSCFHRRRVRETHAGGDIGSFFGSLNTLIDTWEAKGAESFLLVAEAVSVSPGLEHSAFQATQPCESATATGLQRWSFHNFNTLTSESYKIQRYLALPPHFLDKEDFISLKAHRFGGCIDWGAWPGVHNEVSCIFIPLEDHHLDNANGLIGPDIWVCVRYLEARDVPWRPYLRQASAVYGHPRWPEALSRCGLQPDAAAQLAGARDYGWGQAAGWELGAPGAQELPPGHSGVPVLPFCPRVPGEAHLPMPLALRKCARWMHTHHGSVWVPLAWDAHLREVSARWSVHKCAQRHKGLHSHW